MMAAKGVSTKLIQNTMQGIQNTLRGRLEANVTLIWEQGANVHELYIKYPDQDGQNIFWMRNYCHTKAEFLLYLEGIQDGLARLHVLEREVQK